ncbi:hypothetical protein Cs7R123_20540 [Catellatospora sp. TT07R-123]|nr:hypothetical protein Cs7R123_20540 [Catellatospora sp. TT07R-123]
MGAGFAPQHVTGHRYFFFEGVGWPDGRLPCVTVDAPGVGLPVVRVGLGMAVGAGEGTVRGEGSCAGAEEGAGAGLAGTAVGG